MAARMLVILILLGTQNLGAIHAEHGNQIVEIDEQKGIKTNTIDGETKASTKKIMCYYVKTFDSFIYQLNYQNITLSSIYF